jgi:hypothetical protein
MMKSVILATGLFATLAVSALAEDTRVAVDLPPDVKVQFLEHMRTHMALVNNVIRLMADGKVREAGSVVGDHVVIDKGLSFGHFMPPEFKKIGLEFHRATDDFAHLAADIPEPLDAAGYSKALNGFSKITSQCDSCHNVFRVK